jgi:thioredoxin 1
MAPSRFHFVRFALPLTIAALVLTACGSTSSGSSGSSGNEAEAAAAPSASADVTGSDTTGSDTTGSDTTGPGAYITLADFEASPESYAAGDIVLFFNASWCSTCKEARENFEAEAATIPAGLTIVSVDFDDSDELRQKYGVTIQHTFVQVDADGNELAKWNGSVTADEITKQTV